MASVRKFGLTNEDKIVQNERNPPSAMSVEVPSNNLNKTPPRDSYWFAHGGIEDVLTKNAQTSSKSPGTDDPKDAQLQKDKAERIRMFHEQQEEERLKKLKDLEQQFLQAKKHREQQEEERKRRIEEARIKEVERRQQVEERKRQIWEAEQERKEAILRRNMEREARIEARRNAQRNSQCFAFGSSTPRTFDLDLAAIGAGRNASPGLVLMSSVSGRRSEDRELGPPRATSACSLDRKFDMLYHADYSYNQRDSSQSTSIEPSTAEFSNISKQIAFHHNSSNDMKACLSMWDNCLPRCPNSFDSVSSGWLVGSGVIVGEDCMSRSMVSLSSSGFRGRKRTDIMPTLTRERSITPHVTPRGKDTSRSPSRPQSSMSGASEISATSSSISAVNMRARSAPRRPRPYSIAGSSTERTPIVSSAVQKDPERQPRVTEKNAQAAAPKQPRAKSVSREKSEEISRPRKPVPPPKSKEVLARAKSHPVPTKDNLRKTAKVKTHDDVKINYEKNAENIENVNVEDKENIENMVAKSFVESKSENIAEIINSSPITSPVTDSEMCISSEDSRIMTESDATSYNQTFTEPEVKTEVSESVNISTEKQNGFAKVVSAFENIPQKSEQETISINNNPIIAEQEIVSEGNNLVIAEQTIVSIVDNSVIVNERTVSISNNTEITNEKIGSESNDTVIIEQTVSESENSVRREMMPQKPRITSEEEARAALAEKRRLAREKADREAELERQRQEEISRKEEEQQRLEEAEQKRMEEEQIRLAELHRQLEAEKLKKAIEEQKQREKEEQDLKEEEARQKAEKEEQERKAREEAEKQRLELEERLRKEEEERAERKRRVEQIMARTRGKSAAQSPSLTPSDNGNKSIKTEAATLNNTVDKLKSSILSQDSPHILNGSRVENSLSKSFTSNSVSSDNPFQTLGEVDMSKSFPLPDLLNNDVIANHTAKSNGHRDEGSEQMISSKISESNSFSSNRTLSANDTLSPTQTNGYSSHEDMSCTTSPEETSDAGLLIDVGNSPQHEAKNTTDPAGFTRLVEIDPSSLNLNDNYLISVDKVNSNILSTEKSYTGFDERLQKTDAPVVDLLS